MEINNSLQLVRCKAKEIIRKRRINHYYLKKTAEGKTYIAILFDAILVKLVVVFALFVFFYFRTFDIVFSSVITIQFLILHILVSYKIKKIRLKQAINMINEQVAKKKIYKDLLNKTPQEFVEIIKSNLEKCNFNKLQIINQRELDLVGEFNNEKVGIKCFQFSKDYKVGVNITRDFFLTLRNMEFQEGVIITTSSFSEDVKVFLHKVKDYIEIHVIDIDGIVRIMKKAETYPTKKEIERIVLNEIAEKRRKLVEYRDSIVSRKKTIKYFIVATVIFLFSRITPYEIYYQVVAVILYILGIISAGNYVWNLLKSNTEDKTEEIF